MNLSKFDLYLLHYPISLKFVPFDQRYPPGWLHNPEHGQVIEERVPMQQTWAAMEALVDDGLVQYLGVCNIDVQLLRDILSYCRIHPAVVQIEYHPYCQPDEILHFCRKNEISVCCVINPKDSYLSDPLIVQIAQNVYKTPLEVCIKWLSYKGLAVLLQNLDFSPKFDQNWGLSANEVELIENLDQNRKMRDEVKEI